MSKATHVARASEGPSLGSAQPAVPRGPRRRLTEAAHTSSCRFYFLPMTHFSFCLHLHRLPPCPQQSSPRCFFYFFPNREGFGQILCHTGMSRYLETVRTGEGLAPRTQESRGLGPCPSSLPWRPTPRGHLQIRSSPGPREPSLPSAPGPHVLIPAYTRSPQPPSPAGVTSGVNLPAEEKSCVCLPPTLRRPHEVLEHLPHPTLTVGYCVRTRPPRHRTRSPDPWYGDTCAPLSLFMKWPSVCDN